MHLNANTLSLLPEGILTVAGVLVMMLEPVLKPGASRKPLGWLAILAPRSPQLQASTNSSVSRHRHRSPPSRAPSRWTRSRSSSTC